MALSLSLSLSLSPSHLHLVLLHMQDGCQGDIKALVMLKFLEQVYTHVPKFQSQV